MRIKTTIVAYAFSVQYFENATIVAYAFSVQYFENATIVAYAGLRANH